MRNPTIITAALTAASTTILSIVLNIQAFTKTSETTVGYYLGIMVPIWILVLAYAGHHFWRTNQRIAVASFGLASVALVVSLPHIAAGLQAIGCNVIESWCMAVIIDLTQVVAKLMIICTHQACVKAKAKKERKVSKPKKLKAVA